MTVFYKLWLQRVLNICKQIDMYTNKVRFQAFITDFLVLALRGVDNLPILRKVRLYSASGLWAIRYCHIGLPNIALSALLVCFAYTKNAYLCCHYGIYY